MKFLIVLISALALATADYVQHPGHHQVQVTGIPTDHQAVHHATQQHLHGGKHEHHQTGYYPVHHEHHNHQDYHHEQPHYYVQHHEHGQHHGQHHGHEHGHGYPHYMIYTGNYGHLTPVQHEIATAVDHHVGGQHTGGHYVVTHPQSTLPEHKYPHHYTAGHGIPQHVVNKRGVYSPYVMSYWSHSHHLPYGHHHGHYY